MSANPERQNFKKFKKKAQPAPQAAEKQQQEKKDDEIFKSDLFRRLSYSFEI